MIGAQPLVITLSNEVVKSYLNDNKIDIATRAHVIEDTSSNGVPDELLGVSLFKVLLPSTLYKSGQF